jgi:predicted TIM-barrel fold metal-dependent hydrolase
VKIIDAHHHIWRQRDLPWLMGPMQPRIFGPYEPIRRDYPIEEYFGDVAGSGVEKSVYVQANWAKERFEDEVAWVQRTADDSGWPHAIVGYADFMTEDVRPQLDRLAKYRLMRGVRMQVHWHENAMYRFAARPDLVNDAVFRRNLGRLEAYGWSFDLQVFAGQMADAARLAADHPKIGFILQHAGMLEDLSESGRSQWRSGMDKLAARPNVYCKLSGLGTFLHSNDAAHIAEIVRFAIALFRPERCLFGSNFPIEKLWCGYGALVAAYRAALAQFDEHDKRSVFWGTAAKVYRLEEGGGR